VIFVASLLASGLQLGLAVALILHPGMTAGPVSARRLGQKM